MNKIVTIFTVLCLTVTSTPSYADGPIFLDKIKSAFTRSAPKKPEQRKVISLNRRAAPKATTVNTPTIVAANPSIQAKRDEIAALMSRAHATADVQQLEDLSKYNEAQLIKTGAIPDPALVQQRYQPQQVAPRNVIIKNPERESTAPRPIFRNFR